MKALLVAPPKAAAQSVERLLLGRGSDVTTIEPAEMTAGTATGYGLVVLVASSDEDDFPAITAVCRSLKRSTPEGGPLVLALATSPAHVEVFADEGADDFMVWPGDEDLLGVRIELCFRRVSQRSRDIIRAALLADAVRQAERSEQRFRYLAESSTEILMRLSPGGVRLYISPACHTILGYLPDELLGASMFDILHPADVSKLLEARAALDAGASAAGAIIRLQHKDGEYVWLETISRPVRDPRTDAIEEIITVSRDVTAALFADQDKLAEEERFTSFASNAPIGIFHADAVGRVLFINPRASEITGLTPGKAAGRGWESLFDPEERARFAENCPVARTPSSSPGAEFWIRRPDGQKRKLAFKATETRDGKGDVTGFLGTIVDVTETPLEPPALDPRDAQFRAMVEDQTDMVCRYLPDGTLTFVNAAYCRTFGQRAEDLMGQRFMPLIPEEDQPIVTEAMKKCRPESPVVSTEHRVILPSGEIRWQQWYDRGVFDDRGKLVEVLATGRDVTERHRLEQELAEARDFLRDVIDTVPDPISVQDEDRRYMIVNRAYCSLVGRARDEIVGRAPEELGKAGGKHGEPSEGEQEETLVGEDGDLHVLLTKRAVLTGRGGKRVVVSVMRDVTERKRIEAQLVLSDRMASLGTLAAGIAHEINNPLSYVIGNLSYLGDALGDLRPVALPEGVEAAELSQALAESLEGARRIAAIVRDMKVFSRADTETRGLIDVPRVLETSMRMVRNALEHRAQLVRDLKALPPVMGNEARLGQVFVNLLTNALQALPDRDPSENRVSVSARSERGQVVVEVQDNGRGIPAEARSHIFDPFFTTKAVGEGMGLGLSICQGIVTSMGGRIEVESAPSEGTLFRVILPEAGPEAVAAPPAEASAPAPASVRERVLVIDDEPAIGTAVRRMLPEHDIVAVTSAREALDRIAQGERYAAVLCDLSMPGMSGMELLLEIRAKSPELAAHVGFLTGGAFTPAAQTFLDGLPGRWIDKPFDAPGLRRFVETLVSGKLG